MRQQRLQIDRINEQILELLAKRHALVLEIARQKETMGLPLRDPAREVEMITHAKNKAEILGLSPDFAEALFALILKESRRIQA